MQSGEELCVRANFRFVRHESLPMVRLLVMEMPRRNVQQLLPETGSYLSAGLSWQCQGRGPNHS